jgi:hypothetical protein
LIVIPWGWDPVKLPLSVELDFTLPEYLTKARRPVW